MEVWSNYLFIWAEMAKINFFSEGIPFQLTQKRKIRKWLTTAANDYSKKINAINYIFTSDDILLQLNKKYLNHNTLTDIITFNQSYDPDSIEADIYISIDRIRENAINFNVSFNEELCRVIIHGLLHILGFNDKTSQEKSRMRNSENHYLVLLAQI